MIISGRTPQLRQLGLEMGDDEFFQFPEERRLDVLGATLFRRVAKGCTQNINFLCNGKSVTHSQPLPPLIFVFLVMSFHSRNACLVTSILLMTINSSAGRAPVEELLLDEQQISRWGFLSTNLSEFVQSSRTITTSVKKKENPGVWFGRHGICFAARE